MEIKKGMVVWVPCIVNSGPFPDERRVYVSGGIDDDEWFGFVGISELHKKVPRGEDEVRALVLDVQPKFIVVGINGQSPASKSLTANPSIIRQHATL
jgi:hypothetical protein